VTVTTNLGRVLLVQLDLRQCYITEDQLDASLQFFITLTQRVIDCIKCQSETSVIIEVACGVCTWTRRSRLATRRDERSHWNRWRNTT